VRDLPLTAASFWFLLGLGAVTHAADRPNILFIVADDLGYGELGCFGGKDVLTGGGGADTFQFGSGTVTVTDFSTVQGDNIELFMSLGATHADAVTALDALIAATTGDTLSFSDGGKLTLTNVDVHSLHTSDFIVHP